MYKMILSDLDETLLIHHHVPMENRKAIEKARKKGVKFVCATGRAFQMIQDILEEVGTKQQEQEYSICFNGGLVVENKDEKVLFFKGLSFESAKLIFDLAKSYDVCVMIFTLNCCYMFNADPLEVNRKIEQKARFQILDEYNMDFLKNERIAKIIFERTDMDLLKKIEKEIRPYTQDKYAISFSSQRYLEFNALGVTKGNALEWLAEYENISCDEIIAIGDNYNDVSMIEKAGLGVCVSSAHEDIKKISNYVTEHDYDQGAVKEVIERFVLEDGF